MRRILGNLDFETRLAIESRRRDHGRSPPPVVPPAVLDTVSSLATLLRAFAAEGDHLWTPHLVEPEWVEDVPGLPRPKLETGPDVGLKPASSLLAWGETKTTAEHRRRSSQATAAAEPPPTVHAIADWLWTSPPAAPEVAARVNDRAFCLELARHLDRNLPGARMLESLAQLDEHLAGGGAAASPSGEWILKAPFSAAGRERLRHRGLNLDDEPARNRAANLFSRYGRLLFEPWLDRTEDFGCCALLDEQGCRIVSLHRLEVDGQGRLKALELEADPTRLSAVSDEQHAMIEEVVHDVGRALVQAGYRGPFGIDGWWYRNAAGQPALHALGEINARVSFGLVARVLVDRVQLPFELRPSDRWRLRFGGVELPPEGARVIPLVSPSGQAGGAWLEVREGATP